MKAAKPKKATKKELPTEYTPKQKAKLRAPPPQVELFEQPLTLTVEMMTLWHKRVARAAGMISGALSRRKRAGDFTVQVLELLAPVVEQLRKVK